MSVPRTVLITAPGGNIGTQLIPRLLSQQKLHLVLPTSNSSRLRATLPDAANNPAVAIMEGSIKDPQWLQGILTKFNVDTVFLNLTGMDELMVALNTFDAMRRAGCVKHLLYLSACIDALDVERLMHMNSAMHVLVKSTIEQKLYYGGFPWNTIRLGPALFFANDLRSKDSMLQEGVFNEPLSEAGSSRVSLKDIADVATETILNPERWDGQKIMIGSRRLYSGSEIAALWSKALGKPIKIAGTDEGSLLRFEESFAEKAKVFRGASLTGAEGRMWARDLRLMYEAFDGQPIGLTDEQYRVLKECLGRDTESYDDWVASIGSQWRQ